MRAKYTTVILMVVLAVLAVQPGAYSAQKPELSQAETESTEVNERIKQLEAEIEKLIAKYEQAEGFDDAAYLLRVQEQYESYYERAFATQLWTVSIVGFIVTGLFGLAGWFSVGHFDQRIKFQSEKVALAQQLEFEKRLEEELTKLEQRNEEKTSRLTQDVRSDSEKAIADVETRSQFFFYSSEGLIFYFSKQFDDAVYQYREALKIYSKSKDEGVLSAEQGVHALTNLFRSLEMEDKDNIMVNARKELKEPLYANLEDELSRAAKVFTWLEKIIGNSKNQKRGKDTK